MKTSRAQANRLRAIQLRMFLAHERVLQRREVPMLNRMVSAAAKAFAGGRSIEKAIKNLIPAQRRLLAAAYVPVQKEFVELSRVMLGIKKQLTPVRPERKQLELELIFQIEQRSLAAAISATNTMAAIVTKVIIRGEEAGLSVASIATEIRKVSKLSPVNALRIARTETHSMAVHASRTFAKHTELELIKIWLTTTDDRTRDTHISADLQERELDDPYDVGGASLMFPGDPGGPAEEIINCRCGELYEEQEE